MHQGLQRYRYRYRWYRRYGNQFADTDTDPRYRQHDDTERRYAFAKAEAILTPYLEVTEHYTSMFVLCWCYAYIITHYD